METCTSHNGTYHCQLPAGHDGNHAGAFHTAGKAFYATWKDNYSELHTTR